MFAQEPVPYTLGFPAPHTQYLEVTASVPSGAPSVEVFMAVGTPGSCLVREYSDRVDNVDEEIRAIKGFRVRAEQWPSRLDNEGAGETVEVLIARRDRLMKPKLPLRAEMPPAWALEVRPDATDEQRARLKAWLREQGRGLPRPFHPSGRRERRPYLMQ